MNTQQSPAVNSIFSAGIAMPGGPLAGGCGSEEAIRQDLRERVSGGRIRLGAIADKFIQSQAIDKEVGNEASEPPAMAGRAVRGH